MIKAAIIGLGWWGQTLLKTLANSTVITPRIVQPWRRSLTMRPNVKHSPAGIRKIASICRKFVNAVGFS